MQIIVDATLFLRLVQLSFVRLAHDLLFKNHAMECRMDLMRVKEPQTTFGGVRKLYQSCAIGVLEHQTSCGDVRDLYDSCREVSRSFWQFLDLYESGQKLHERCTGTPEKFWHCTRTVPCCVVLRCVGEGEGRHNG